MNPDPPASGSLRLPRGLKPVRRLGQSPLSEVYLVEDEERHAWALKVLRGSAAKDSRIRERWRREALLLEEIRHPNLVRSFGAFEVEGRPALLLEYIEGPTLRDMFRGEPLPWEHAARLGMQVARALQKLHRHGALHRDVKPHNILIHQTRGAVLADLGLVRRREDPTLTRQGAALGSPAYMSPEQARDPSDLGPEADVYSLGATLYHALSGRPPFLGSGVGEVIHRVLHTEAEPLPAQVPEELQAVVAVAMAKEPENRYARARDLGNDLERVLVGIPPRLVAGYRRRRRIVALAAAGCALVVLAATGFFWPDGDTPNADPDLNPDLHSQVQEGTETRDSDLIQDALPPPPNVPVRQEEREFELWATPFRQSYLRYQNDGRLRLALQELEVMAAAELPAEAGPQFSQWRDSHVRQASSRVLALGEQVAARAEAILQLFLKQARRSMAEEEFQIEAWDQEVREAWKRENLPVEELPLYTGGPDPMARLRFRRLELEQLWEERLGERARRYMPARLQQSRKWLRRGEFEQAEALWQNTAEVLLSHSLEGRREKLRVEELNRVYRRVQAYWADHAGRFVDVPFRSGNFRGRLSEQPGAGGRWQLQTGEGPMPIALLALEPSGLGAMLHPTQGSELLWLQGQLLWCQGRTQEAIDTMASLALDEWAPSRSPDYWIRQWESEPVETDSNTPADQGESDQVKPAPTPLENLVNLWRRDHPTAEVEIVDGGVEIVWQNPSWGEKRWRRELHWPRNAFEVQAWSVRWQLAADHPVPRSVHWLGGKVRLEKPTRTALPAIWLSGTRIRTGKGIVPGAEQNLSWSDGALRLDGETLGSLPGFEIGSRVNFDATARPGFTPQRVWIRVVPES
ncbi:MAG: serine/threonine protein kinase [Planctomycetota bacterium]|nr:MAG: serine/threonine protein kinase [Planctomycetota bacterium]